jgi:hypothetical protein
MSTQVTDTLNSRMAVYQLLPFLRINSIMGTLRPRLRHMETHRLRHMEAIHLHHVVPSQDHNTHQSLPETIVLYLMQTKILGMTDMEEMRQT